MNFENWTVTSHYITETFKFLQQLYQRSKKSSRGNKEEFFLKLKRLAITLALRLIILQEKYKNYLL